MGQSALGYDQARSFEARLIGLTGVAFWDLGRFW